MLQYWYLLPVGVVIGTLVMSAGVSGATLWVPVYLLWLKLPPQLAFWLGLFTMLFGFSSGVFRNWRDGSYDRQIVRDYVVVAVPAALAGGYASGFVDQRLVVGAFGVFLLVYGVVIGSRALGMVRDSDRHNSFPWMQALAGGALTGLISIGVGILAMNSVLKHRAIRTPGAAIGSLVMIIFFTSLASTIGRMSPFLIRSISVYRDDLLAILIWAAPAVVIGGQIGPRIAQAFVSERQTRLYFSAVLLLVGVLTLARAEQ